MEYRTLRRHRADVHVQVHIGALYGSGAYGWTTDAKPAIAEFEQRLAAIGTDYADFGFIHCIDEDADLDRVMNGGIWDYAQARRADGTIRHLAFSTHSPHIARRLIATGAFDLAMFSLNPMYDYTDESEYGKGGGGRPHGAAVGDELAAEHYRNLEHHAGECVGCGHCDSRCPFGVAQSSRMREIAAYLGM